MTGVIPEYPLKQFLDSSGNPIANGRVYTWQANSIGVTPLSTWADKGQIAANANPIVLDSEGKANIWLAPLQVYDFVVKDSTSTITYSTIEDISGVPASITVDEWQGTGLTPTFISTSSFTVPGNQTSKLKVGSRLRITDTTLKYATVISSVFSSLTTIVVSMDSGVITSLISAVDVGNLSPDNPSGLYAKGNLLNLSSYTGADIALNIGQITQYDVNAVISLLLRISTSDNQLYKIDIMPNSVLATVAGNLALLPNNAVTGGANDIDFLNSFSIIGNVTPATSAITKGTTNSFVCSGGNSLQRATLIACTKSSAKSLMAESYTISAAADFLHADNRIKSVWNVAGTWTSLGTLNFNAATTGRITVKRIS